MSKVTPVIPESLIVTGIGMPAKHDYIAEGAFGQVFRGELQGVTIALKKLHRFDNINLVSRSYQRRRVNHQLNRLFVEKH